MAQERLNINRKDAIDRNRWLYLAICLKYMRCRNHLIIICLSINIEQNLVEIVIVKTDSFPVMTLWKTGDSLITITLKSRQETVQL